MYVTMVYVDVKPEFIDAFIQASHINHLASIKEDGNFRFDVLQMHKPKSQFILYEAYSSELEAAAHKSTDHYLTWRATVADWMNTPRKGVRYNGLFPDGK